MKFLRNKTNWAWAGGFVILIIASIFFWGWIFGTILKCGFGPGLADYTYQLNKECQLGRNSAYVVYVVCVGDTATSTKIPEEIFSLGWNEDFVLAKTHPVTKTDPHNPTCKNCDPDNSITYWWIADVKAKRTYGPFPSDAGYFAKLKELSVPPGIQLMSVDEAKAHATWLNGDFKDSCK